MELFNTTSIANFSAHETIGMPYQIGPQRGGPPFDEFTFYLIDVIIRIAITGTIALFGIITNIVNFIVFYSQGIFSDSCTLSLAALSISDFICCLLTFWGSICRLLGYVLENPNFSINDFFGFTSIRPKSIFSQITCWLTAYIAFERFVSIAFPFKVKFFFTPRRSLIVVVGIFLGTSIVYFPQYLSFFPKWAKQLDNSSKLIYVKTDIVSNDVRQVFLLANPVFMRIVSMCIVVMFNLIIVWKLKLSIKFRDNMSSGTGTVSATTTVSTVRVHQEINTDKEAQMKFRKEIRLHRMIFIICTVFVICYTPDVILVCFFIVGSSMGSHRYHPYILDTAFAVNGALEIINSSCNIIIYYTMSSRYKDHLRLCLKKRHSVNSRQAQYVT